MKKSIIMKIKDSLEKQRKELVNKFKQSHDEVDFSGDETDFIQGKILAFTTSQLANKDKERLHRIEEALGKIANGKKFGECEECGEDIAEKRLLFNPCFVHCIACAENIERDLRQRAK